jgi:hypothetical protein
VRLFQEHLSNEKGKLTVALEKGVGDELVDEKSSPSWYMDQK